MLVHLHLTADGGARRRCAKFKIAPGGASPIDEAIPAGVTDILMTAEVADPSARNYSASVTIRGLYVQLEQNEAQPSDQSTETGEPTSNGSP